MREDPDQSCDPLGTRGSYLQCADAVLSMSGLGLWPQMAISTHATVTLQVTRAGGISDLRAHRHELRNDPKCPSMDERTKKRVLS